jgi:hypothetical protein
VPLILRAALVIVRRDGAGQSNISANTLIVRRNSHRRISHWRNSQTAQT